MGLIYFKYEILNVEICWKTMYMPTFRKETGKNGQQVAAVRYWITESFKRFFQNGWILPERIKWLFLWMFSESVIHPSQRFGFEHKMKQKQRSRSCHIAELSGAFLLTYLEIYKLRILKHIYL